MNEDQSWLNDLHKQFDDAHHTTDRADAPPPGLWHQIRAQVQPQPQLIVETKESHPMITTATMPQSIAAPIRSTPQGQASGFRHYVNFAATVALVFAVAVGGWLAMMQVNQPAGGPEPRFAALGLQPDEAGNGVCDVEPLTVDEAISILKDPLATLVPDVDEAIKTGFPEEHFGKDHFTRPILSPAELMRDKDYMGIELYPVSMEELQPVANEYLDCSISGTNGQRWQFLDRLVLQYDLAGLLPTLTSEEGARELLPAILDAPSERWSLWLESDQTADLIPQINPDLDLGVYFATNQVPHMSGYAIVPIQNISADGSVIFATDVDGDRIDGEVEPDFAAVNMIIGYSALDREWYVIGMFNPTYLNEMD